MDRRTVKVTVSFDLEIDPEVWRTEGRPTPSSAQTDAEVAAEVRQHAENVVRDLFYDMGWTPER